MSKFDTELANYFTQRLLADSRLKGQYDGSCCVKNGVMVAEGASSKVSGSNFKFLS